MTTATSSHKNNSQQLQDKDRPLRNLRETNQLTQIWKILKFAKFISEEAVSKCLQTSYHNPSHKLNQWHYYQSQHLSAL